MYFSWTDPDSWSCKSLSGYWLNAVAVWKLAHHIFRAMQEVVRAIFRPKLLRSRFHSTKRCGIETVLEILRVDGGSIDRSSRLSNRGCMQKVNPKRSWELRGVTLSCFREYCWRMPFSRQQQRRLFEVPNRFEQKRGQYQLTMRLEAWAMYWPWIEDNLRVTTDCSVTCQHCMQAVLMRLQQLIFSDHATMSYSKPPHPSSR